jgi:hypothetical protein
MVDTHSVTCESKEQIMRIAIVGAANDNETELLDVADAAGHHVATHDGVLAGPSTAAGLRALVLWSDLVLIRGDAPNDDAAVTARGLARRLHRPARIVKRLENAQLAAYFGARLNGDDGPREAS